MAYYRVTYASGGVTYTFPYPQVSASEEPVWSDDGIQLIGTRYRVTVRGTLVGTSESDFRSKMLEMRCKTRAPRGQFRAEWSPDNITYYSDYSFDPLNADWGPFPNEVQFDRFTGGRAANYSWSVETTLKECFGGACSTVGSTTNVLAVTRRYSHAVDESGFTIRTVSGTLYVMAAEAAAGRDADYWRWTVTPPLAGNFERVHQHFDSSPDGTQLRFAITDREVMWTLPAPVTKGHANWSLRLRGMGGLVDLSLTGEFEAHAGQGKDALLQRIGELVLAKFPADPGLIWESRQVSESIYDNKVSFAFSAYMASLGDVTAPDWVINLGGVPPGSTGAAQFVGPYGGDGDTINSGVKANSPVARDACAGGSTDPLSNGGVGSGGVTSPTITLHQDDKNAGSPGDGVSADHRQAPYVEYHEKICWEIDNKLVTFTPKKAGADHVIQQTGVPQLHVIQAGYLVRDGTISDRPSPPEALYGRSTPTWQVKRASIEPASPTPLAVQGQYRWVCSWNYLILYRGGLIATDGPQEIIYPTDRRTDEIPPTGIGMLSLPHLVQPPQ